MKEIPLTQGYVALVDDEDYARVSQFSWNAHIVRRKDGSISKVYAAGRNKGREARLLHRFILEITDPKTEIDHEDGNGLNCQRGNIRVATSTQNKGNQKVRVNSTSGFKGVSWSKAAKKWHAYLNVNKKRIYLGLFTDQILASASPSL